jgi:hypothetical protein
MIAYSNVNFSADIDTVTLWAFVPTYNYFIHAVMFDEHVQNNISN